MWAGFVDMTSGKVLHNYEKSFEMCNFLRTKLDGPDVTVRGQNDEKNPATHIDLHIISACTFSRVVSPLPDIQVDLNDQGCSRTILRKLAAENSTVDMEIHTEQKWGSMPINYSSKSLTFSPE